MEKITVVVTVLNEQSSVKELLTGLKRQNHKPSEVIIVDGGSIDKTVEIIKSYKNVRLFRKIGNRSVGRNFGVSMSVSQIIAFTDAGCIPHVDWLGKLAEPFKNNLTDVVAGYYEGKAANTFEKSLIPYVLVMPDRIPSEFLPATRSMAIRREAWNKSGGFDEKLSHNEDYAFAIKLKKLGMNFAFAREAVVTWLPRQNLKSAAWMFMRFAIGDAQSGILRSKVKLLAIRYYLFFFLCFVTPWSMLLVVPYIVWAILKNFRYVKRIEALFWLPVLQITSDIMVLFGTIVGLLSRM